MGIAVVTAVSMSISASRRGRAARCARADLDLAEQRGADLARTHRSTDTTLRTRRAMAEIRSATPAGAVSVKRRWCGVEPPARQADEQRHHEAAAESANCSRTVCRRARRAPPRTTTCRRKNEGVGFERLARRRAATRDSTRARQKSMTIEARMMANAASVASTAWPCRRTAVTRLPRDDAGEHKQKHRFGERRDRSRPCRGRMVLRVGRLSAMRTAK